MVALRSQGNWRWEGPLGTPLGLVHWKRASSPVEAPTSYGQSACYTGDFRSSHQATSRSRVAGGGGCGCGVDVGSLHVTQGGLLNARTVRMKQGVEIWNYPLREMI